MPDFDVLVAGELNPDLILSGADLHPAFGQGEIIVDDATFTIGSSAAIFAAAAAKLDLRVGFVGVVGDDQFGQFMLRGLEALGVDVSPVIVTKQIPTGFSVILSRRSDRAILTYVGAISKLRAEQISDALLARSRHLHVASYFLQRDLQPGLPALLRRAKSMGMTISLDTNWDPEERWGPQLDAIYPMIEVLFPNEQEARLLGQAASWQQGAANLAAQGPLVVVKRGEKGATVMAGEETITLRASKVEVVDTTGAGDNFNAGFLRGYLAGWPLEPCLRLAIACGSLSTQAAGGTGYQADLDEALQFADVHRPDLRDSIIGNHEHG